MAESVSIGALRRTILRHRPGATVWGKGDPAHALVVSGHNEDDDPAVRAEMQDSDSKREWRSIDVKIDGAFTRDDTWALLTDLTAEPTNRRRLLYVIFNRRIYRRSTGYVSEPYTGSNPHTGHLHASGHADDDENGAAWTLTRLGGTPMTPVELHALLTQIVNADEATERQIRDMIVGGQHSKNPTGYGLLTPVRATLESLIAAVAGLANGLTALESKVDQITVGAVDNEAIAQRVAELLAQRLQS
jgi:hypothetical protein